MMKKENRRPEGAQGAFLKFATASIVIVLAGVIFSSCSTLTKKTKGPYRIVGTVKDKETGKAIKGAAVLLMGAGLGTVTSDGDGEFRIDHIHAGSYNLEVTHPDYKDVLILVTVDANSQPTTSSIEMIPK